MNPISQFIDFLISSPYESTATISVIIYMKTYRGLASAAFGKLLNKEEREERHSEQNHSEEKNKRKHGK